ncbi:MucBP domain-containing protein [Lapidilactobacillus mulanensis]|uniref:MucBP domain-containing protein n=1 Tax=Lapidilactobacillus mulanensis TaxID=2485999 RepID=UPI0013DE79BC|nr:MucBP domain-containing protein [Lapidilactobacillus mulanensis]
MKINKIISRLSLLGVIGVLGFGSAFAASITNVLAATDIVTTTKVAEDVNDWMPNASLQKVVLANMVAQKIAGVSTVADITKEKMAELKVIQNDTGDPVGNTNISIPIAKNINIITSNIGTDSYSLEGLQYATNVVMISLRQDSNEGVVHGDITDLSPLSELEKLKYLVVDGNRISDLKPIANLVNSGTLTYLDIRANSIADFSPLKKMPAFFNYFDQVVIADPIQVDSATLTATISPDKFITIPDGQNMQDLYQAPVPYANAASGIVLTTNPGYVYGFMNGATTGGTDDKFGVTYSGIKPQEPGLTVSPWVDYKLAPLKYRNYLIVWAYTKDNLNNPTFKLYVPYTIATAAVDVAVHYQDEAGNQIAPDDTLTGYVGDEYHSTQLNIAGYTFKKVANDNASGTFTAEKQTVTYIYTKNPIAGGDVTVYYQDEEGNQLAPNDTLTGFVGDEYQSTQLDIPGYTFKLVENASGIFTTEKQQATYIYTKDIVMGADVTVHYQDDNGNTIAPDKILGGNIGDTYQTNRLTIPGYTYKKVQGDVSGNFTGEAQTVTYIYTKDPVIGSNVTVHYQDEAGNQIAPNDTLTGFVGDDYHSTQLRIAGYTFKEVENDNAIGKFTTEKQTVTYIYTKNPVVGADVTVHYQDEAGNPIAPDKILSGNIGETYQSEKLVLPGYTFKEVQGNVTGAFTADAQTVKYIYTKDPVVGGGVTVNYQDDKGQTIAPDKILSGNIGEAYETEKLDISGYTFREVQGQTSGTFAENAQTVTYIYTKNPVAGADVAVHYQDEAGNPITPDKILSGNIGDAYQTEKLAVTGYTFKAVEGNVTGIFTGNAQTVTYIYTKNPVAGADVMVHYQDNEGNQIAPDDILSGNVGNDYQSTQLDIAGYTFTKVENNNASGKFTADQQTVTYIYTKNPDPIKTGRVIVHYQDENGQILSADIILNGNVGDHYQTTQKQIAGYTWQKVLGKSEGDFENGTQEVTYVYVKKSTTPEKPNKPDQPGNSNKPNNSGHHGNGSTNTTNQNKLQTLPQTNENSNIGALIAGLILVIVAAVSGMLMFVKKHRAD